MIEAKGEEKETQSEDPGQCLGDVALTFLTLYLTHSCSVPGPRAHSLAHQIPGVVFYSPIDGSRELPECDQLFGIGNETTESHNPEGLHP